ncbi:MAG: OmpA family protein [Saprospiraceae bacterium]
MLKHFLTTSLFLFLFVSLSHAQKNYRVHITTMENAVPLDYFTDLEGVWTQQNFNELHRYYLGDYATEAEAQTVVADLQSKGYAFARVLDLEQIKLNCECSAPVNKYVRNLFFDFDRDNLRAASRSDLTTLSQILKENPTYKVQLIGHTDSRGSNDYNVDLSKRRAANAQSYLEQKGVTADRISIEYRGEVDPIAVNELQAGQDSPQGRQFNRRVIVQITDAAGKALNSMVEDIEIPNALRQ